MADTTATPHALHDDRPETESLDAAVERLWMTRRRAPRDVAAEARALVARARGDGEEATAIILEVIAATSAQIAGDGDDSLEICRRGRERCAELGAERWRVLATLAQASLLSDRTEFTEARSLYEEALAGARALSDAPMIQRILLGFGNTLLSMGESPAAIDAFQEAARIASDRGDRAGAAAATSNIGNVHAMMGEKRLALGFYEQAFAEAEAAGDRAVMLRSLGNAGITQSNLGEHAKAHEYHLRVLELARAAGDVDAIASTLINLGGNEVRLKRYDDAREHLGEARRLAESVGNTANLVMVDANLGIAMRELERFDEAIELHRSALELAEQIGHPPLLESTHEFLASTYEAAGDHRNAMRHLRESHRYDAEWRSAEARRQVHAVESARQVEIARKEAEIERLRNVELAEANAALQRAHDELAEAHEKLKRTQAQLVHAEKMASLGQLTAGIAHEINNPTNFIRSSVGPLRRDIEMLLRRADETGESLSHEERAELVDEVDSLLKGIEAGAVRTADIVRGLRTFSRLDEDELKPVDLREAIEAIVALQRPRLDRIEVTIALDGLPMVECRPGQLNQALMNIVANAIDAIDGDGALTIEGTCDGETVRIAISDTGRGMTSAEMARIFEPFYTTKDVGKGTGLGLAITHAIIDQHRGHIGVESEHGRGSRFTVMLPLRSGG